MNQLTNVFLIYIGNVLEAAAVSYVARDDMDSSRVHRAVPASRRISPVHTRRPGGIPCSLFTPFIPSKYSVVRLNPNPNACLNSTAHTHDKWLPVF